jgi:hypothetical protein
LSKLTHPVIGKFAGVIGSYPSRIATQFVTKPILFNKSIKNRLGAGAPANISETDKKYLFHNYPIWTTKIKEFVGQNLGAFKKQRTKSRPKATLLLSTIDCIYASLLIIHFGHQIMSPFASDSAVIQISRKYMITVSSFYPLLNHLQLRWVPPWHWGYTGLYDYNLCCFIPHSHSDSRFTLRNHWSERHLVGQTNEINNRINHTLDLLPKREMERKSHDDKSIC